MHFGLGDFLKEAATNVPSSIFDPEQKQDPQPMTVKKTGNRNYIEYELGTPTIHPADNSLLELPVVLKDTGNFFMHLLVGDRPYEAVNSPMKVNITKGMRHL